MCFKELSFAEAASSKDPLLAQFDLVALHGVFSWVGPLQPAEIVKFRAAKLVPGGLVYVSYNALPGWTVMMPLQRLLKEYADRKTGDSLSRLREGLRALQVLADRSTAFVVQNPAVKAQIDSWSSKNQNYLVQEFLQDGWEPLLASPVLGSAIRTTYFDRLAAFVGIDEKKQDDKSAAAEIFDSVEGAGRKLLREGRPMDRSEENLRELEKLVLQFRTVTLPAWQKLGILQ